MYSVVATFIITWITICFFDIIFKTCMFHPYIHAMMTSGITIKPFYFKFYTTHFNRYVRNWVNKLKLLRLWFDLGIYVTCLLIVPAVLLLTMPFISVLTSHQKTELFTQMLQPVVPGFNLPLSELIYYMFTLFLCSVVHEVGHALAAVREDVPIAGCGFFIFILIPASFVDFSKEALFSASTWQKLRIFSAGIWHNVVLSCCAILMLLLNPMLFSPMFRLENGITTLSVQSSSLSSSSGLSTGDQITMVNNCAVYNLDLWKSCLKEIALNPHSGYCISESFITSMRISSSNLHSSGSCCGNTSTHLCFKYFDSSAEMYACLPVRDLVMSAEVPCRNNSQCTKKTCVTPMLMDDERLIVISRQNKPPVLFVGSPKELFAHVSMSPWTAKQNIVTVQAIHIYETLLKYIASFSGALAILNVIPCPGLDGQWLCQVLIDSLLISFIPKRSHRTIVVLVTKIFGCILLLGNVALGVYKLMA